MNLTKIFTIAFLQTRKAPEMPRCLRRRRHRQQQKQQQRRRKRYQKVFVCWVRAQPEDMKTLHC